MKRTREQKKSEMMAKAEELIEQLLDWEEGTPRPSLTEIEDMVLKLRKRMGEGMAELVMREQEEKEPVPGPACPKCGREMQHKGGHENHVESRVGSLGIERVYYYCPECKEGLFPPG